MSLTWLVLVLPATFAEVIGLSLVVPGKDGYLHVQVYTGCMYLASFVFSELQHPLLPRRWVQESNLMNRPVWALRTWKIHSLACATASKEQREEEVCNADTLPVVHEPRMTLAFAVKTCFSVTKV